MERDGNPEMRQYAAEIDQIFTESNMEQDIEGLSSLKLGQIPKVIDNICNVLSDIWERFSSAAINGDLVYPQSRMENTFSVISKAIGVRFEREFYVDPKDPRNNQENDIWQPSFSDVRLKL